jgi:hypothetical protein
LLADPEAEHHSGEIEREHDVGDRCQAPAPDLLESQHVEPNTSAANRSSEALIGAKSAEPYYASTAAPVASSYIRAGPRVTIANDRFELTGP